MPKDLLVHGNGVCSVCHNGVVIGFSRKETQNPLHAPTPVTDAMSALMFLDRGNTDCWEDVLESFMAVHDVFPLDSLYFKELSFGYDRFFMVAYFPKSLCHGEDWFKGEYDKELVYNYLRYWMQSLNDGNEERVPRLLFCGVTPSYAESVKPVNQRKYDYFDFGLSDYVSF